MSRVSSPIPAKTYFALALFVLGLAGCGGGSSNSGGGGGGGGTTPPPVVVNNTLPAAVNLGPTPASPEANVLFASVTICVPGTNTCQTIPNVQVDTGSSGLRLLASQVTLTLPRTTDSSGNSMGNCVSFLDTSYMWGPVVTADIQLAGEKATSVPIQIASSGSFPAAPSACSSGGTAISTVSDLGATGILGIGLFRQDCGSTCVSSSSPGIYFACPASGCVPATASLTNQIQNPVWMFPQDNNGVLVSLPALSDAGAATATGALMFGVATQTNNALNGARTQTTDANGNFTTTFNGTNYNQSFIDSGSNGIFFLSPTITGIPACAQNQAPGFYCPASQQSLNSITTGANGTAWQIPFKIANAVSLVNSQNGTFSAFNNLGGPQPGFFDWGLPFFYGRNVFIGIEGQTSAAGTGPFWAY